MSLGVHPQIPDDILLKSPSDVIMASCIIDPHPILWRAVINRHGTLHQPHIPGCKRVPQKHHKRRIVHDMAFLLLRCAEVFYNLMRLYDSFPQKDNRGAYLLYNHLIHFQKCVHLGQVHG